jgi:TonB family protein
MKTKIARSLFFLACIVSQWAIGARATDGPFLEKLTIPPYPFLARLTGIEGSVQVNLTLDPQCNIGDISIQQGPHRLVDAVTRAALSGGLGLRFRGCSSKNAGNAHLLFVFSLRGQPTNAWSPTYVHLSSEQGLSYRVEITTTPADLEALGLEKSARKSVEHGDSELGHFPPRSDSAGPVRQQLDGKGTQEPSLTDLSLPGYPPLARVGRVQGKVEVEMEVDSDCRVFKTQVVTGHPLLNSVVLEAVRKWHFTSCAVGGGRIDTTFHFELVEPDDPGSDDWTPTHLEMTGPYEFQIKAVAPDPVIYN